MSLVHYPVSGEISQVAWSKEKSLLLTKEGQLYVLEGQLSPDPEFHHPEVRLELLPTFLPSPNSKRIERKLTMDESGSKFAIWWTMGGDVFPWNPNPEQRANVLVYALEKSDGYSERPSLIFFTKTEDTLLGVYFSGSGSEFITVEESLAFNSIGKSELRENKYDISSNMRIKETVIPLQNQLKCHAYDKLKVKLCLGLCDSSVIVSFHDGKISRITKGAFVPSQVAWHEDGMVILTLGDRGEVQMFDLALNPLFFCDHGSKDPPSLTMQLEPHGPFRHVSWAGSSYEENTLLLLRSQTGNISVLNLLMGRMNLLDVIMHHMGGRPRAYREALSLLKGVPWDSDDCKSGALAIFRYLAAEEYSERIEGLLDELFELFFNPGVEPLEHIWKTHESDMINRALDFSHWLLRAGKFARALEIAEKFDDEGTVFKIYKEAVFQGASEEVTKAKSLLRKMQNRSDEVIGETSSSSSTINRSSDSEASWTHPSSCSTCSSSESSSSDETDAENQASSQQWPDSSSLQGPASRKTPSSSVNAEQLKRQFQRLKTPSSSPSTEDAGSSQLTVVQLGSV